jgi:hypothetical protein
MPNHHRFPPELLDCIVDLLHDDPKALSQCSLVSKSWVPRTRKHLFAAIKITSPADLNAWKKTFADPTNSPARYTTTLFVDCSRFDTAADVGGGWIRLFSGVVELEVWNNARGRVGLRGNLIPFFNFSPVLKSLRMSFFLLPLSEIFALIPSLPLLEDLAVSGEVIDLIDEDEAAFKPSKSPPLTGTFTLHLSYGMENFARRLLDLPNGLHFRKFACMWRMEEDLRWVLALVERCSDTLECIEIRGFLPCMFLGFCNGTGT